MPGAQKRRKKAEKRGNGIHGIGWVSRDIERHIGGWDAEGQGGGRVGVESARRMKQTQESARREEERMRMRGRVNESGQVGCGYIYIDIGVGKGWLDGRGRRGQAPAEEVEDEEGEEERRKPGTSRFCYDQWQTGTQRAPFVSIQETTLVDSVECLSLGPGHLIRPPRIFIVHLFRPRVDATLCSCSPGIYPRTIRLFFASWPIPLPRRSLVLFFLMVSGPLIESR